jgi:hypothetical protein
MTCTLKATVKGAGGLFGVTLHPENDLSISPVFKADPVSFSEWKTDPFSIDVEGDFDYTCTVGGPNQATFELTIEIKVGSKWVKLVDSKKGRIGSGCGNVSKPKNKGCIVSSAELPKELSEVNPTNLES